MYKKCRIHYAVKSIRLGNLFWLNFISWPCLGNGSCFIKGSYAMHGMFMVLEVGPVERTGDVQDFKVR